MSCNDSCTIVVTPFCATPQWQIAGINANQESCLGLFFLNESANGHFYCLTVHIIVFVAVSFGRFWNGGEGWGCRVRLGNGTTNDQVRRVLCLIKINWILAFESVSFIVVWWRFFIWSVTENVEFLHVKMQQKMWNFYLPKCSRKCGISACQNVTEKANIALIFR
jgi:hypothetical protein